MDLKKLLQKLVAQLPSEKLHGLGTVTLLVTVGLLSYYEYTGDSENAKAVLLTLLGLILPAPFRSRNDDEVTVVEEPSE